MVCKTRFKTVTTSAPFLGLLPICLGRLTNAIIIIVMFDVLPNIKNDVSYIEFSDLNVFLPMAVVTFNASVLINQPQACSTKTMMEC